MTDTKANVPPRPLTLLVDTRTLIYATNEVRGGKPGPAAIDPAVCDQLDPEALHMITRFDPWSPYGDLHATHGRCCVNARMVGREDLVLVYCDLPLATIGRFASWDGYTFVGEFTLRQPEPAGAAVPLIASEGPDGGPEK